MTTNSGVQSQFGECVIILFFRRNSPNSRTFVGARATGERLVLPLPDESPELPKALSGVDSKHFQDALKAKS
jgi:hypothetical protein